MNLVYLTPGAGGMYCGNCFRDNSLVAAMGRRGHDAVLVPLYLPLTLDEADQSESQPIFFGGLSVYLEQVLPLTRFLPRFVHRWLASRTMLQSIGDRAAATQPANVGELTVSMLRGEHGRQAAELDELCRWLRTEHRPDVVCISDALLLGMHRKIKAETGAKTVCFLTGEDGFLDKLKEPFRTRCWELAREHASEVDLLVAPSRFYAEFMSKRLNLPDSRIRVLYNGLHTVGFDPESRSRSSDEPTLGFFARMSRDKGIDLLVDAFIEIHRRGRFPRLKLKLGGGCTRYDEPLVAELKSKLRTENLLQLVEFHPNVNREDKIALLQSFTLFVLPARGNTAFGLTMLESWGAGVPTLLPDGAAFPELLELSGAGALFQAESVVSLADRVEELLADEPRRQTMQTAAATAIRQRFNIDTMADEFVRLLTT